MSLPASDRERLVVALGHLRAARAHLEALNSGLHEGPEPPDAATVTELFARRTMVRRAVADLVGFRDRDLRSASTTALVDRLPHDWALRRFERASRADG